MIDDFLQRIYANQWLVLVVNSLLLMAAAEFGFRRGLRLHTTHDEARKEQIGGIQGALLGLLALLLGFTFAMAVGRFENRRELVLRDANSIGTTYLRASLLPAEHTDAVRSALRQYIDARLAFSDAGTEREAVARAEASAAKLQAEVWNHATAAGKEAPTPMTAAFVLSLNETIDLDAMRLHALREHVPGAVWLLVLAVAICGCWTSSYGAGSTGARSGFTNVALPIVIAVVITLVADLDRPRSGLIRISQQPMLDLQASFAQRQPASQR